MFRTVEYETQDGIALEKLGYDLDFDDENGKIEIRNNADVLNMNLNRRIAQFNGIKVWFYSPAKLDKYGDLRIGRNDIEKIMCPLFNRQAPLPRNIKRIVVDAGHGGEDSGAIGAKYKEKDLNLALSRKIKTALEAKGFEVIMTRDEDKFLTLDERSEFAEKQKADIFICVHHNAAASSPLAHGIETYSLTAAGEAGSHDRTHTDQSERKGNKFDTENIVLNYLVQSKMIEKTSAYDRGVKFARYKVLVQAPCPAILLEAGFVSNKKEEDALNTDTRQKNIADAVAEAVCIFAGLKLQ